MTWEPARYEEVARAGRIPNIYRIARACKAQQSVGVIGNYPDKHQGSEVMRFMQFSNKITEPERARSQKLRALFACKQ